MNASRLLQWTLDTPDERIALVRLSCGHAKVMFRNWPDLEGLGTYCDVCDMAMAVVREIAREAK